MDRAHAQLMEARIPPGVVPVGVKLRNIPRVNQLLNNPGKSQQHYPNAGQPWHAGHTLVPRLHTVAREDCGLTTLRFYHLSIPGDQLSSADAGLQSTNLASLESQCLTSTFLPT